MTADLVTAPNFRDLGGLPTDDGRKLHAQLVVLAIVLPLTAVALMRVGTGVYLLLTASRPIPVGVSFEPGELPVWQGRQGWRGLDRLRLGWSFLASIGPVFYAYWLWQIWSGTDPLALRLLWSFFATMVLGGSVAVLFSSEARLLLNDVLGTMYITDRRIVWRNAHGVYRELRGAELIGAALVEGDASRGWITVTQRRRGRVAEIDLFGVPRPLEAVVAIEQMMASEATAPEG